MPADLQSARALLTEALQILTEAERAAPSPVLNLSVTEFAREVGRGTDWVYDQIRRRRITPCRIGKPYRIPRSELLKLRA